MCHERIASIFWYKTIHSDFEMLQNYTSVSDANTKKTVSSQMSLINRGNTFMTQFMNRQHDLLYHVLIMERESDGIDKL